MVESLKNFHKSSLNIKFFKFNILFSNNDTRLKCIMEKQSEKIILNLNTDYSSEHKKILNTVQDKLNYIIASFICFKNNYLICYHLLKFFEEKGYVIYLTGTDYNEKNDYLGEEFFILFKSKDVEHNIKSLFDLNTFFVDIENLSSQIKEIMCYDVEALYEFILNKNEFIKIDETI